MATRSRARHFHATAKALTAAAADRTDVDGMLLSARVSDVDVQSIIAGVAGDAGAPVGGAVLTGDEVPMAAIELPASDVDADALLTLHEELRWAESKLMHASERLADAQEHRRKDLVALAVMRRELVGSFHAERAWLTMGRAWTGDVLPALAARELELQALVDNGVRTEQVIHELAAVRVERKLVEVATAQIDAQLARVLDSETTTEYQVASEAYDREPDGAAMRDVARLRAAAGRSRRDAARSRTEARTVFDALGFAAGLGEVTAAYAFLLAEYEGDERSAERMDRVRSTQFDLELTRLPEVETALKAAIKHPVHFMRARRTSSTR